MLTFVLVPPFCERVTHSAGEGRWPQPLCAGVAWGPGKAQQRRPALHAAPPPGPALGAQGPLGAPALPAPQPGQIISLDGRDWATQGQRGRAGCRGVLGTGKMRGQRGEVGCQEPQE